ncbi:MAG: arsenate reductase family protein [Pacificimonas sp.]|jgi:arsenate reductase|nr:arsenate reductase family protein [Pacificimonas sp.]
MAAILWFNPRCGTARNVQAWLDEHGKPYEVREYLKDPPSRAEIEDVLAKGKMQASDLLREKEPLAEELGLRGSGDQDAILAAMADNPILINRPVIIDGDRAKLCRPSETIADFYA